MICSTCGVEKPEDAFPIRRDGEKVRRRKQCQQCRLAGQRAWTKTDKSVEYRANYRETNRERIAAYMRDYRVQTELLRRYGITTEEFFEMVERQEGKCAVCERECELQVDHDHETGVVRGLLCGNCNRAAGLLHDEPDRALSLAFYLARAKEVSHGGDRNLE
jgi:glycerol-3-phosphate dehydrogenase